MGVGTLAPATGRHVLLTLLGDPRGRTIVRARLKDGVSTGPVRHLIGAPTRQRRTILVPLNALRDAGLNDAVRACPSPSGTSGTFPGFADGGAAPRG